MRESIPKLLLVEDDKTLADVTAFRLELLGYEVVIHHSAEDALQWIESELPDLVILDLALPGVDGLELTNRLKNEPRTTDIPVMAFSTAPDLDMVQRAYAAGVREYLVTPYDPAVLEEKLESMLQTA